MNYFLNEGSPPQNTEITWRKALINLFFLFSGIILFLFSIELMGTAFNNIGSSMADSILMATSNPFISLFIGLLMTALIQSSSTSTSMIVVVVAAGSISFRDAIPMIMGANIGTTLTSTIVSLGFITKKKEFRKAISAGTLHDIFNIIVTIILFPLEYYYNFLSILATNITELLKVDSFLGENRVQKINIFYFSHLSTYLVSTLKYSFVSILISIILLFFSIRVLSQLIYKTFIGSFKDQFKKFIFKNPIKSFSFGLVLTAGVQSSSITTSLIVPLVATGKIGLKKSFPFIMGANIGTTITALITSLFRSEAAIAIAMVHLLFNFIGVLIFLPFPVLRKIPLSIAAFFGRLTIRFRFVGFIYIIFTFFILPFALIYINKHGKNERVDFPKSDKYTFLDTKNLK